MLLSHKFDLKKNAFFNLLIIAQNPYSLANIGSIYAKTRVVQSHACLFILNVVQNVLDKKM